MEATGEEETGAEMEAVKEAEREEETVGERVVGREGGKVEVEMEVVLLLLANVHN